MGLLKCLISHRTTGSPSWELQTASPRGRYGERRQRDPCLKYTYIKTPLVGRRQPMTSLPARPQYKGRRENTSFASSSSLTVFFEACILVRVQFFSLSWRALARRLRFCVDPCPRYLTPDDTHNLCVFCLGKEHTRDVLEGKLCVHSFCPSFQGKRGSRLLPAIRDPPLPRHGGELN